MTDNTPWVANADQIETANVTALARMLGASDFDELYAISVDDPRRYWDAVNAFCRIVWSRPYTDYADFSDGIEFPKWFIGGELNWVDTVLQWAEDPATAKATAITAEREDGSVRSITYADLRDQTRAVAAGLKRMGVARGDRVGLLIENGIEAVVSILAVSHLGAIIAPLFSGFGADAIVSRLDSCAAKGLIISRGFSRRGRFIDTVATAVAARERLPSLEFVVVSGADEVADLPPGFSRWADILGDPAEAATAERMSPDDPFMVIYTSGTTGKPKGAVHIHGGFPLKIAIDAAINFNVKPGDVYCWPADVGWIAGSLVIASAILRGATLVCYDGAPNFPDWSRMSRLIERHRVTHFGSSPTLIRGMAANEAEATAGDMSTVELLITAGETISAEHFLWYQRAFGRGEVPVINYTGGTEVSGGLLSNVLVKPIVPSGFNAVTPGLKADVVDPSGKPVRNAIGELAVLGPFVGMTQSFWQDRERYLDSYWRTIPGIWVHGDLSMRNDDGVFFLLGRSDDTIKVAGKRVGPAEIEHLVAVLPEVDEAAVIGVEDAQKGQALVLFVVLAAGADPNPDEIRQRLTQRIGDALGKPFAPKEVHVVSELPKTRSQKIMRRVIRSVYSGGPAGDLTSLVNPHAIDEVKRVIAAHRPA